MKASDIAIDLMAEACDNALLPGDFCIVQEDHYGNGYVNYSRYCRGGSYIAAALFSVQQSHILVITPIISGIPEGWKHGKSYEAPMYDPDVIEKVSEFMKGVFSKLQLGRDKWGVSATTVGRDIQVRYKEERL